jgi:hypothetical protein
MKVVYNKIKTTNTREQMLQGCYRDVLRYVITVKGKVNEWMFPRNEVRRTATRLRVNATIRPLSHMPLYGAHKDKATFTLSMS